MGRDAQGRWIASSRTQALGHPWLVRRLGAAMLSLLRWCPAADIFQAGWVVSVFQNCRNPVSEIIENSLLSVHEALSLGKPFCNETWAAELSYVLGNGQFPVGLDTKVQMFFLPLKKSSADELRLVTAHESAETGYASEDGSVTVPSPLAITERGIAASSGAAAQSRADRKEKPSWVLVFLLNNLLSTLAKPLGASVVKCKTFLPLCIPSHFWARRVVSWNMLIGKCHQLHSATLCKCPPFFFPKVGVWRDLVGEERRFSVN